MSKTHVEYMNEGTHGTQRIELNASRYCMPFGKYKGESLGDIPAHYLLWLADEADSCPKEVKEYVEKERRHLEKEAHE